MESPATPAQTRPVDRVKEALHQSWRNYRELAGLRAARRLLGAAALSYAGDRFNTVALIALSFNLGDGALGVGGMLALFALPRFLLQGPAGALVDRYPGGRLLIASQLLLTLVAAAFALLAVFPSLWLLYGLVLAMGALRTVALPAFEVQLMGSVPPARRGTANAVHMLAITSGDFVGPLLGGLLLVWLGTVPLFLLNGLSYFVVAVAIWRLRGLTRNAVTPEVTAPEAPLAGGSYLRLLRRPDVALYISLTVFCSAIVLAAMALFVVQAIELGLGEGGVGVFFAVIAVGTAVGGTLAGAGSYTGPRSMQIAAVAVAVQAVSLAIFGFAGTLVLALGALVAFGLTADLEEVAALTYFQNRLPANLYGHFFSLFLIAVGAGGLIGPLAGPLMAEAWGTGVALTVLSVPCLVLATYFAVREGSLHDALPAPALAAEPEVAGYGLFVPPAARDQRATMPPGVRAATRLHRLA